MKILHVNKFFDAHGGAEVYMHRLMSRQRDAGHEVHAFSTRSVGNMASEDSRFFISRSKLEMGDALNFIWNREARSSMQRALKEIQPDIVHIHNIYHHISTSILSPIRALKIPCVQTLHDYKLACPNYKMYTEGLPCERCKGGNYFEAVKHNCLTSSFAGNVLAAIEMGFTKSTQAYEKNIDTFICPSQFMANKMIEWGEPANKIRVILNPAEEMGIDMLGMHVPKKYVLAIGRLSPEKGFDIAIRAIQATPGIFLRIAGSGPMEESLKKISARNVEFIGYADKAKLYTERSQAVALVVPTLMYENSPLVVLEALSQGLPVIASRIGGLPELIEHNVSGYLVKPGDAGELAAAISRISTLSESDWKKMSDAARLSVEKNHSWHNHLKQIFQIYADVGAG